MVKTYRTIQQWNHWLTQHLGQILLNAEKQFLSQVLANRYGKHVVLIGVPQQAELLETSSISNRVMVTSIINRHKHLKCIESNYSHLPITPGSVDLVIIPHLLDLLDNPRQLLAEACRVVKPEGLIIILGFNAMSLWGLKKWWVKSKNMPWLANFIQVHKVKNWLKLADFELIKQDMLLFSPPIANYSIFKKFKLLEWLARKIHIPFGAVYALTAQAKTIPLTPIKLHWKQTISALHVPMPGPTSMRDVQ